MTMNITQQTQNFFGDSQVRDNALQSISGYMYLGFMLIFALLRSTAVLFFLAFNDIVYKIRNPRTSWKPDATLWCALVGYLSGAVLGYAALGHLKAKNDVIYEKLYTRLDGSPDGSLQLGDPDVALRVMDGLSNLITGTTLLGAGVAYCVKETCSPGAKVRSRLGYFKEQNTVAQNPQDCNEEGVELLASVPDPRGVVQVTTPRLNN